MSKLLDFVMVYILSIIVVTYGMSLVVEYPKSRLGYWDTFLGLVIFIAGVSWI